MKNVEFKNAVSTLSSACWTVFLELHAQGKPLPEGIAITGNGTGYFDPMVQCLVGVDVNNRDIYSAVCPNTGRRMVIVPLKAFYGLSDMVGQGDHDTGDSLVFFERYTPGHGSQVIIEQLSQSNNVDCLPALKFASLLFLVGDWLV